MKRERQIRRAQAISPFGVGAIIDILGESFVAEDASRWRGRRELISAPRIAAYLDVTELRTPPATGGGAALPYYRFPQWLFCGRCRRMSRWSVSREKPGQPPRCDACPSRPQLVPMRFVTVCGNGHLDDVDWRRWAHSRSGDRDQRQCGATELDFRHVQGVGGGLESLQIVCRACKAARDLRDLVSPDAMPRIGVKCGGRQPWQYVQQAVTCDETPVVLQRGASSVYFPEIVSAIDLPPDSDWSTWGGPDGRIAANENFKLLLTNPDHPLKDALIAIVANEENVKESQVRVLMAQQLGQPIPTTGMAGNEDLTRHEWHALTNPRDTHDPRDNFVARRTPFPSTHGHGTLQHIADELADHVADVVLVERLREIRVLKGLRRHTMKKLVPSNLASHVDFLPAIEIFGEGVFIRLDEPRLAEWAADPRVRRRCEPLRRRLAGSFRAKWLTGDLTPRLILLHTLAHALIRRMSFVAGYSSSSLRERLYAAEPATGEPGMAGILIYTAAGDAEGTLGGLARLGQADRLVPVLAACLDTAQWCSLDPVCRESTAQGPDGLSLAACHACALASETSCIMGNLLLDRMLLVDDTIGYFRSLTRPTAVGAT